MAEFKIGRLRFTWAGVWTTATFYNRDAVASYNGKTYVCLEPHTATNFYSDLNHVELDGAPTPRWVLMLDGKQWKQAWLPNTFYSLGNIVRYGGIVYTCTVPHTSAAVEIDLSKWTTLASYDKWNTGWTQNTAYGIGDVVKYGGIVYRCNTNHVSAASVSLGLEADQSKWSRVNVGIEYLGSWSSGYRYRLNDVVRQGAGAWICTQGHTSASEIDESKFVIYLPGEQYEGTWSTLTNYQKGDVVMYGGYSYISLTANNNGNIPSTVANEWAIQTVGYEIKNEWDGGTGYKIGNVVCRHGQLFVARQDNSSQDPTLFSFTSYFNSTGSTGNTIVTYSLAGIAVGSIVVGAGFSQGQTVVSTATINSVTTPISSGIVVKSATGGQGVDTITVTNATGIVVGMTATGTGLDTGVLVESIDGTTITLTVNNIQMVEGNVTFGANAITVASPSGISANMAAVGQGIPVGSYVSSIIDSTVILSQNTSGAVGGDGVFGTPTVTLNNPPDGSVTNGQSLEFVGVNYIYWELVVPGVTWTRFWETEINYVVGDLVIWKNITHRCIKNHNSSVSMDSRPDLDVNNAYWTIYARHAVKNALANQGDIVTYEDGETMPLDIGTEDYILTSQDNQPTWRQILTTPKNYYVSTNGVDADLPGQGLTWDRPWASVAYAAQKVLGGTENPNAAFLIKANKVFLTTEMYNYMLYRKANSLSPFTPQSEFDQVKTIRDANYLIDGVVYDLTRGGNSQSVQNALAYFKPGTTDTFFSTTVAAEMPYFISALNFLTTSIGSIINNSPVQTNYQILNGVLSAFTTNATATDTITNQITVGNTSRMSVGQAITFTGIPFGNVMNATTYYIAQIVDNTTITISATQGGDVKDLIDGTGNLVATGTGPRVYQTIDNAYPAESGVSNVATSLASIVISALTTQSTTGIPAPNQGVTATINVKTGTYFETLPIVIPANTAINGDELRGTVIYPKVIINTFTKATSSVGNLITVLSTAGLEDEMGVQFAGTSVGGLVAGRTYYVIGDSISDTQFSVSETVGGTSVMLSNAVGSMAVYGGDAIKDMFRARNGSGVRNLTMSGLLGTLTEQNQYLTQRPTGGAYVALDPGTGPNDTTAWITKRSPYAQNCTMFGQGCTGLKIDGALHNGGNKSIVANDFTTILSDGIGAWVTNSGAVSELVSVFAYYSYAGYFAENGGRIRATNGNTSYGTYGCIAEGYDDSETPISGSVFNRINQAQAQVQSSFGTNANLLKLQYSNAGSGYDVATTNLMTFSNNFLSGWTTDGNLTLQQNLVSPNSFSDGWTLTGSSATANTGYLYQNTTINPTGGTFSSVGGSNITGSGTGAAFDITVGATAYTVTINALSDGGSGYIFGNQIKIFGSQVGGTDGVNDITITITETGAGSKITAVTATGTVPPGSSLNYSLSLYVKKGSATTVDLQAIFSGNTTVTSGISFNFNTVAITATSSGGGMMPTNYGIYTLNNGWYRIWFSAYDNIALNTTLQMRIYPKGVAGTINTASGIYGAQTEINDSPSFYLSTSAGKYTSYADYIVNGAGTGAVIIADETRTGSVFETRVTDLIGPTGPGPGGAGYLTASNNAQGGTPSYIMLAGSDNNTATQYTGMRLFVNSGTGAGQYGYISYYDPTSKFAYMLKETFTPAVIVSATSNTLTLDSSTDVKSLYINQPVQFIPTYYTTTVTATSKDSLQILTITGGTFNFLTTTSTARLALNMEVTFSGTTFGGVTTGFTYYIVNILNETDFQISTDPVGVGDIWLLNTASGTGTLNVLFPSQSNYLSGSTTNMLVNMPIQFNGSILGSLTAGTLYYVSDVISSTAFTVSTATTTVAVSASDATAKTFTVDSSLNLVPLNPILFSGTVFGGVITNSKYYISKVIDNSTIQLSSTLITTTATATTTGSNLITVTSTSGFVVGNPVKFVGKTFGNLQSGQVYYVVAINDLTSFAVSTAPGGSAVALQNATGVVTVRTSPTAFGPQTVASGSMTGTTTIANSVLSSGSGNMNALYSTNLFGNVVQGTTYYIMTITPGATNTIQLTDVSNGAIPITFAAGTGSMQMGEVGWDHINAGTPAVNNLDSTSLYFIEARPLYSKPAFSQTSATLTAQAVGTSYVSIAYGDGRWMAVASGNATASTSTNGTTWSAITLPNSSPWSGITYGNKYWVAISQSAGGADSGSRVIYSASSGAGWRTSYLPSKTTWSGVAYGNGVFVAIASGGTAAAYSTNYGNTWSAATLPTSGAWSSITYGQGKFVAVASGRQYNGVATSNITVANGAAAGATFDVTVRPSGYTVVLNNDGANYTIGDTIKIVGTALGGTSPANDITITVSTVQSGLGANNDISTFSFTGTPVATTSTLAAYSTNGSTWIASTLPASSAWSSVEYGAGRYVAISSIPSTAPVISFDGISWVVSKYTISAETLGYGQGVFLALSATGTTAYTSEDGLFWTTRTVSNDSYGAVKFGLNATTKQGFFATVAGQSKGSLISAGCQTKGRPTLSSGRITGVTMWEPGSGYVTAPTTSFFDPNVTTPVTTTTRIGNGALGAPTFVNRGVGYNTNSTQIVINGNGYADSYQTGLSITVNNLTKTPRPGDNLVITGNENIYKVTNATVLNGTVAPNITATIQISPEMTTQLAPDHGTGLIIRQQYSQVRLTGHDFLNIGFGNAVTANYPGLPADPEALNSANQAVETNYGRVFYTSTDQDGNFLVGLLFGVQQATGIVTLSATQFGLSGLDKLSLGGISVGGSGVVVSQFSTDQTFVANSNSIIPTQRAIKGFLTGRLSQGGANVATGQATAGTVVIGGPDKISNTIPQGTIGSSVVMRNKVNINGSLGGIGGNMTAGNFFYKQFHRR